MFLLFYKESKLSDAYGRSLNLTKVGIRCCDTYCAVECAFCNPGVEDLFFSTTNVLRAAFRFGEV
jgi:hypothetical protein